MKVNSALALTCAALTGCAVAPSIDHRALSDGARTDAWVPYQITDTTLVIGTSEQAPLAAQQGGEPKAGVTATTAADHSTNAQQSPPADVKAAEASRIGGPSVGAPLQGAAALLQPLTRSELYPVRLKSQVVHCTGSYCDDLIAVTATPVPFDSLTLAMTPRYHDFVRTYVAPTYYPNTLRLHTLEVSVHDERQEAVDTVGAIVSGVRELSAKAKSAPEMKDLRVPIIIDLSDAKSTAGGTYQPLPLNEGQWWYRIRFFDDPLKAGFLPRSSYRRVHDAVLTSLCRRMDITLTTRDPNRFDPSNPGELAPGESKLELGVTVADPDYLLVTPLPPSGTITFSDLCGADVKMNTAVSTPTNAIITDFFNQVNSMRRPAKATPTKASH